MKRPTIYDVAAQAGVSIATVSRVLHNKGRVAASTRENVLAVAKALEWTPSSVARGLTGRGHGALAIVFPEVLGPYFSEVIRGFDEAAVGDDRSVLLLVTHARPDADALVLDLSARVDGMVVMDRTVSDEIATEIQTRIPVVLMARPPAANIPSVRAENIRSATALTRHLLVDHGYEDVAFLGDPAAAPDVDERWNGFLHAHRDAGIEPPQKPILTDRFNQHDGVRAAERLLAQDTFPRALVCANDEEALGVLDAARKAGVSIPHDLAISGWDDIPAARLVTPALTTVRQPMRDLGATAGRILLGRLLDPTNDEPGPVLDTELLIRHSCGC